MLLAVNVSRDDKYRMIRRNPYRGATMARPQAAAKLGYYPAHPLAITQLVKHLKLSPILHEHEQKGWCHNIMDPCAGRGVAIDQIREALGIPEAQTYAIELDPTRVADIRALMPKCNLLGPASFIGSQINIGTMGLAYVNAPFDDELGGGGREEQTFSAKAAKTVVIGGTLVVVCPLNAIQGNHDFVRALESQFRDITVYKFPDGYDAEDRVIRGFREVAIFGKKRRDPLPADVVNDEGDLAKMNMRYNGYVNFDNLPALGEPAWTGWARGEPSGVREEGLRVYGIPGCKKTNTFARTAFTAEELIATLERSPLNKFFDEVTIPPPERPPLPLAKGHLGLLLAGGLLNGVVRGPHGPHVVRGSSKKIRYHNVAMSRSTEDKDGVVTSIDTYSQRMVTVIRCVEQDGVIYTHSNAPKEDTQAVMTASDVEDLKYA
jgi:hypothetical protein